MRRFVGAAALRIRRIPIAGLAIVLAGILSAIAGLGGTAQAQTPAPAPAANPVQPWGLPPLPPGVGPVEKFADVSDTPHSPQNLNCGGFSNPHAAQRFFIGAAQLPQNFIPAGFSVPQLEHRIVMTLSRQANSD